jgi:hypothetical protein
MKTYILPTLLISALSLVGCADCSYSTSTLNDNFGKTVNQMVSAQIANQQAAIQPQANSPQTMDGYAAGNIIRTYRNGFGQDAVVQAQPSINISTSSSQ